MAGITPKVHPNRIRPTVGVTGPDRGGGIAWLFTSLGVWLAGGKPVRITPAQPRTADGLQALIIGGGADVDPNVYQQEHVFQEYLNRTLRHPRKSFWQKLSRFTRWLYYPALFFLRKLFSHKKGWSVDPARDHLELQLLDQAVRKNLPVLGICRGSQLINVYFRGTLHQDIGTFYSEEPNPSSLFPVKRVRITPGSRLAQVLQVSELKVNALHHQAVKEPGTHIDIVAQEANGVVQGIENRRYPFLIGVQWHPEYLPQYKGQRRLFNVLVQQAREVCQQKEAVTVPETMPNPYMQLF